MPLELVMGLRCRAWNSLPNAGGIMDQPAGLLDLMAHLLGTYNAHRSFNESKGGLSKWIKSNPEQFQIVWDTRKLREAGPQ